jgi:predicted peptidase
MRSILVGVFLGICFNAFPQSATTPAKEMKSKTYSYLVYLPDGFKNNEEKKWPLVIYLHGKSACGNNLDKVRRYGMPFYLDRELKLDAIAVAPQCPAGKNWVADNWFMPFLEELKEKYPVDENRIYLTGMSLGGFGTFSLAIKYPEVFAAVAPLCGGGQPYTACPMKNIPTWVIHGDKDEQVPVKRSIEMVEAIRKCGGNPKLTILEGQPHDIHRTYGNMDLYEWMLSHSKNKENRESEVPVKKVAEIKDTLPRDSVKEQKPRKSAFKKLFKSSKKKKNKDKDEQPAVKVEFN